MIENYLMHLGILICVYIILSVSLNIAFGYTGLINLGHIAFFGIGAYTSALLNMNGVPWLASFILAGVASSVMGALLIYGISRLKGDYLALATLGFNFIIYALMLNLTGITRGPLGLVGIPRPELFGVVIGSIFSYLLFAGIVMLLCLAVMYAIVRSPYGRVLEAIRDDELGARMLGKNTFKLKTESMMISAFFAGLAGSLFAHYITFIDPSAFVLSEIILVFTIVIVGGIASFRGSIFATIFLIILPEALRFIALPSSVLGPLRQILYALILLLVLLYKPRGLFGRVDIH